MSYLPPSPQSPTKTDFKAMWATRPVRIPRSMGHRSKIAGVCEGIGVRYQIDPTVVRVCFLAAMLFGGAGFPAYFLAWAYMPRYGSARSPIEQLFNVNAKTTWSNIAEKDERFMAVCLLFIVLMGGSGGSFSTGLTWISLVFLLVGWWLLHSARPIAPMNLLVPTEKNAAYITGEPVDLSAYGIFDPRVHLNHMVKPEEYQTSAFTDYSEGPSFLGETPRDPRTPPAWDPLGAAPFAWDLPEPGPAPSQPAAKEKGKIWPWVVGGALFTGTVVALSAAATWPAYWQFAQVDEDQGSYESEYSSENEPEGDGVDVILDNEDFSSATKIKVNENVNLGGEYITGPRGLVLDLSQIDMPKEDQYVQIQGGTGPTRVILPKTAPFSVSCLNMDYPSYAHRCEDGAFNIPASGQGPLIHIEAVAEHGVYDVISAEKAELLMQHSPQSHPAEAPEHAPAEDPAEVPANALADVLEDDPAHVG